MIDICEVVDGPVIGVATTGDLVWDPTTCSIALDPIQIRLDSFWGPLFGLEAYCAMAGKLVELEVSAYDYGNYGYSSRDLTATVRAVLTLRPGVPCIQ